MNVAELALNLLLHLRTLRLLSALAYLFSLLFLLAEDKKWRGGGPLGSVLVELYFK